METNATNPFAAIVSVRDKVFTGSSELLFGMRKIKFNWVFCGSLLVFAGSAGSTGFGLVTPVAVLGQPLNFSVPIHLDVAERFTPDCVSAVVVSGEVRLPPGQVQLNVVRGASPSDWVAQISTTQPIEEPVVEVTVSAGCDQKFSRTYTAFADPPQYFLNQSAGLGVPSSDLNGIVLQPRPKVRRFGPSLSNSSSKSKPRPDGLGTLPLPHRAKTLVSKEGVNTKPPPAGATREEEVARLLLDVGGPHLKLDMDEPVMMSPAAMASAAAGVTPDVDPDLARLQVLERSLNDLKRESKANQDAAVSLKERLASSEAHSRLLPWIVGLLILAVLIAIWLSYRLRQQVRRSESPSQWWVPSAASDPLGPVPEPPPSIAGELVDVPAAPPPSKPPSKFARPEPAETAAVMPLTATASPTVAAVSAAAASTAAGAGLPDALSPTRDVSVEELLDLEQQAEFFIALGQEDAAVDLLMSHLRGTGGQSPLPYTKLLEIYRRQGDRAAYERVRARFNRRFNAYAPDWEVGPLHGRVLEDYPDVISNLQTLWLTPIDAMANLEALLFRKDESREMFDLPAYQDVLLLYSLARDLWHTHDMAASEVDVLLPLGDSGSGFSGNAAASTSVELPRGDPFRLTNFDLNSSFGGGVEATLDPDHVSLRAPSAEPGDGPDKPERS
jgi:hypothetical protein